MSTIDDIDAYAAALMQPPVLAEGLAAQLAAQQLYQKAIHDRLILWMREMEARIQALEVASVKSNNCTTAHADRP
jgi:hypothetical protein